MRLRCGRSAIIRIRKNPYRMPSSSLHIWERIRHALTHLRYDSHRPSFTICAAWVRNTEPRTLSPRPSFAEIDSRPRTSRGRTDRIWENQKSPHQGQTRTHESRASTTRAAHIASEAMSQSTVVWFGSRVTSRRDIRRQACPRPISVAGFAEARRSAFGRGTPRRRMQFLEGATGATTCKTSNFAYFLNDYS